MKIKAKPVIYDAYAFGQEPEPKWVTELVTRGVVARYKTGIDRHNVPDPDYLLVKWGGQRVRVDKGDFIVTTPGSDDYWIVTGLEFAQKYQVTK